MALVRYALAWWARRPWAWKTERDTGITIYQRHVNGQRRVIVWPKHYAVGYQPIDWTWVHTGEWASWVPIEDDTPRPRRSRSRHQQPALH